MSSIPVNLSETVLVFIGLVVLAVLAFEAYRYIKAHPQMLISLKTDLSNLENKVKGVEGKVSTAASSDLAAVHAKLDSLASQLSMVHTAVQNPTQVVVTSASPPPAAPVAAPVASPTAAPVAAAPAAPVAPPAPPVPAPLVVTVPIDPAAFHAMLVAAPVGTEYVSQNGYPLSATGQEIIPAAKT